MVYCRIGNWPELLVSPIFEVGNGPIKYHLLIRQSIAVLVLKKFDSTILFDTKFNNY